MLRFIFFNDTSRGLSIMAGLVLLAGCDSMTPLKPISMYDLTHQIEHNGVYRGESGVSIPARHLRKSLAGNTLRLKSVRLLDMLSAPMDVYYNPNGTATARYRTKRGGFLYDAVSYSITKDGVVCLKGNACNVVIQNAEKVSFFYSIPSQQSGSHQAVANLKILGNARGDVYGLEAGYERQQRVRDAGAAILGGFLSGILSGGGGEQGDYDPQCGPSYTREQCAYAKQQQSIRNRR